MIVGTAGHIDHGKTTLIRALTGVDTDRLEEEKKRGISIQLGYAYTPLPDGQILGFIDVPGHERLVHTMVAGATGIDFGLLIVAADDGVMPQTVEAINHARAAEVPIIVAVNKIDKPDADLERVKRGLSEHGLVSEDWGGDTVFAPVSAKTQEGIPHLLEMLLLQADILELRANPDKLARGTIVEAKLDRGRGPVAPQQPDHVDHRHGEAGEDENGDDQIGRGPGDLRQRRGSRRRPRPERTADLDAVGPPTRRPRGTQPRNRVRARPDRADDHHRQPDAIHVRDELRGEAVGEVERQRTEADAQRADRFASSSGFRCSSRYGMPLSKKSSQPIS